ncbi:hypothetical protein ACFXAF_19655 [Kitasatospora sp. NPDC059463]|uniref:hypothetical protein n=1 Tax=unclassified Kitasatospora TaxID=2633591 RepID=UPI0036BC7887
MLRMNGPLRITVLDKDAYYEQRVVVHTPYGTFVLEGRIGASLDVRAEEWELELQHCVPGVGWRPNVRVLPYPWQTSRSGARSRIVRSKDCDWPNGDPTERNLILRLSGTVTDRTGESASPAAGPAPGTRGETRTSSGTDFGAVGGRAPAVPTHGVTALPGVPAQAGRPVTGGGEVPAVAAGHHVGVVPAVLRACGNVQPQPARLSMGRVLPAEPAAPVAAMPAVPAVAAGPVAPVATASEAWAVGR